MLAINANDGLLLIIVKTLLNNPVFSHAIYFFSAKGDNSPMAQFLELFILGNSKEYSKKLFNSWEVLQAYITCTFLYGNTFVLGVDVGDVRNTFVTCSRN